MVYGLFRFFSLYLSLHSIRFDRLLLAFSTASSPHGPIASNTIIATHGCCWSPLFFFRLIRDHCSLAILAYLLNSVTLHIVSPPIT